MLNQATGKHTVRGQFTVSVLTHQWQLSNIAFCLKGRDGLHKMKKPQPRRAGMEADFRYRDYNQDHSQCFRCRFVTPCSLQERGSFFDQVLYLALRGGDARHGRLPYSG